MSNGEDVQAPPPFSTLPSCSVLKYAGSQLTRVPGAKRTPPRRLLRHPGATPIDGQRVNAGATAAMPSADSLLREARTDLSNNNLDAAEDEISQATCELRKVFRKVGE